MPPPGFHVPVGAPLWQGFLSSLRSTHPALAWTFRHLIDVPAAAEHWRAHTWSSESHVQCEALFSSSQTRAAPLTLTILGGSSSSLIDGYGALLGRALQQLTNRSVDVRNPSHGYSGSDFAALYLNHLVPAHTDVLVWEMSTNDWPLLSGASPVTPDSRWRTRRDLSPEHTRAFDLFIRRALGLNPRMVLMFVFLWQPRAADCYPRCANDSLLWDDNLRVLQSPPYASLGGSPTLTLMASAIDAFAVDINALAKHVHSRLLPTARLFADKHHPSSSGHILIAASLLRHLLPFALGVHASPAALAAPPSDGRSDGRASAATLLANALESHAREDEARTATEATLRWSAPPPSPPALSPPIDPLEAKGVAQWRRSRHCRLRVKGLSSARVRQACLRAEGLDHVRARRSNQTEAAAAAGNGAAAAATAGDGVGDGASVGASGNEAAVRRAALRVGALVRTLRDPRSALRGVTFNPPAHGDDILGGLRQAGVATAVPEAVTSHQQHDRHEGGMVEGHGALPGTVAWRGRVSSARRDRVRHMPLPQCTEPASRHLSFIVPGRARFVGLNVRSLAGVFDGSRRAEDERLLVSRHVISGPLPDETLRHLRLFASSRRGGALNASASASKYEEEEGGTGETRVVPFARAALLLGGADFISRGVFAPQVWAELPSTAPVLNREASRPDSPDGHADGPEHEVVTQLRLCRDSLSVLERRAADEVKHVGSIGGAVFV